MGQIENAVKDVLALDIDSGFRCKGGPCTCPMNGNGAGDDSFQPSKGRRLSKAAE